MMLQSFALLKGKRGHVLGWQTGRGIHGQLVLTPFSSNWTKPAKTVKIDGLPENVVPITRGSKNIECTFSSDLKEHLHRSQVWVLPNFSMTDYTSQGKTRPKNSVEPEQLPKPSILLHLFVEKCDCKWNCHCAVVFPSTHHM